MGWLGFKKILKLEKGSQFQPNNSLKKHELKKGLKGDWKKEGYKLKYHPPAGEGPYSLHGITAHNKQGKEVAELYAEDLGDGTFQAHIVNVHPEHQRKGLASAMYSGLQSKTGLKAVPDLEAQTKEGAALWRQKKRSFGKSTDSKSLSQKPFSAETKTGKSFAAIAGKIMALKELKENNPETDWEDIFENTRPHSNKKIDKALNLEHYSSETGLKEIDPKFQGQGVDRGKVYESRKTEHPHSFFYIAGTEPEHIVTSRAKSKYSIDLPDSAKIYDISTDPDNIIGNLKKESMNRQINPGILDMNEIHSNIKQAGYHGFTNSGHDLLPNVVALYHSAKIKRETKL